MGTHRSAAPPTTLPAPIALAAVVIGLLAMQVVTLLVLPFGLRAALVASEVTLVLPALLAARGFHVSFRALGLTPLPGRTALLVALAGLGLWAASLGLFELQYSIWKPAPGYLEAFRRLHEALRPSSPADALLSLVTIAMVPALAEETLVRGIVLPSLLPRLGAVWAVLVSAALFAALHLDPYRTPFTLALGVALGILRLGTGSLTATVLAHTIVNTVTFLAAPFTDDPAAGMPEAEPLVGAALLLVGGALSAWLLRRLSSTAAQKG